MTETDNAAQPPTNDEVSVSSTDDTRRDISTDAPCRRRTRPRGSGQADGAWSVANYEDRLKKAKKHVGKMQATIQRAADDGQRGRVRCLRNELLRSYDARLVATHEANTKLRAHRRRPLTRNARRL